MGISSGATSTSSGRFPWPVAFHIHLHHCNFAFRDSVEVEQKIYRRDLLTGCPRNPTQNLRDRDHFLEITMQPPTRFGFALSYSKIESNDAESDYEVRDLPRGRDEFRSIQFRPTFARNSVRL